MIKFNNIANLIKRNLLETFKLLWAFKWYVCFYLFYYIINIISLFNLPEEEDKIFHAEATSHIWSYTNQKVYVGSLRMEIIILSLLFLVGTSNMRNHPKLAKFTFLSPLLYIIICLIKLV